jgi:hypothetical protein
MSSSEGMCFVAFSFRRYDNETQYSMLPDLDVPRAEPCPPLYIYQRENSMLLSSRLMFARSSCAYSRDITSNSQASLAVLRPKIYMDGEVLRFQHYYQCSTVLELYQCGLFR